jgi:hypothetical protein
MQPDKQSLLTAQVESLKEVVSVLEASKADEIAQKWRAKLFEAHTEQETADVSRTGDTRAHEE